MPHVNLYIREEDWEPFQAIKDRPEWLHRAIVGPPHPNMALPTTLAEANDPKSPGYSAKVKPHHPGYLKPTEVNPKSHGPVDG